MRALANFVHAHHAHLSYTAQDPLQMRVELRDPHQMSELQVRAGCEVRCSLCIGHSAQTRILTNTKT